MLFARRELLGDSHAIPLIWSVYKGKNNDVFFAKNKPY